MTTPALPSDDGVLVVRAGPGGTCSAAGSALDLLFGAAVVATAALAAVLAFGDETPRAPEGRGGSDAPPDDAEGRVDPGSGEGARARGVRGSRDA